MIKHPALAILFLLAAALSVVAQERAASGVTGSIRGTVIDSKTGQPLNGATVALHSLQGSGEGNSVTTSADGRFSFAGLGAGRYGLSASHNGYLDSAGDRGRPLADLASKSGMTISLTAGQEIDDVVLRLTPTGVIAGRITSERDEPMPGVQVQTLKSSYANGYREFTDARAGFTDDRGEFRIWGLAPGQYYVRATNPRRWAMGSVPREIYVPMFFPGVTDPGRSQAVELHSGEEVNGIYLMLTPSRTVHVKGRVLTTNATPAKGAQVTLTSLAGNGSYSVEAGTDDSGRFEMAAVPSGSYVAVAQFSENADSDKPLTGRTPVQVGDTSVDGVDVVVFPGATVSGRVRVEGDRKVNLARIAVSLKSSENSRAANLGSDGGRAAVAPDGTFVLHDVSDGNYRIALTSLPDGYYVRPEGEGVEASVLVSHGHAAPVEVRLRPGAGQIEGTVYKTKNNDEVAPSSTVALVPDQRRRANSEYYRLAVADRSGRFVIGAVIPGDYRLFAWQDVERGQYLDPDFIQQYEDFGKPIHVEEGSRNGDIQLQLATQTRDNAP
jgi:5-hydroxyisourate hydrolase-like protein (transthyretin family)